MDGCAQLFANATVMLSNYSLKKTMPRPKCTYKCPSCPCYWVPPPQLNIGRLTDNAAYNVCKSYVCVCVHAYTCALHTHTHTQRLHCAICLPIVDINVDVKASSEKRNSIQVFPTPESPISKSLKSKSYVFFAISRYGTRTDAHALTHTGTTRTTTHTQSSSPSHTLTLWFYRTKHPKIHTKKTHTHTGSVTGDTHSIVCLLAIGCP